MTAPVKIPIDRLKNLPLFEAMASLNDPNFFEVEDVYEFRRRLGVDNSKYKEEFSLQFFSTYEETDPTEALGPMSYNSYRLLDLNSRTLKFVSSLAGKQDSLEDSDIRVLERSLGDKAASSVRRLKELISSLSKDSSRVVYRSKKYGNDAKFKIRLAELNQMVDKCFGEFNRRFGTRISPPKLPNGVIIVMDQYEASPNFIMGTGNILISSDFLLRGESSSLIHELAHMWFCNLVGYEKYISLPKWFREGLAIMAADQLEDRRLDAVPATSRENILKLLNPKNQAYNFSIDYYYSFGLAANYLVQVMGRNFISRLAGLLKAGKSFYEAISALGKKSPDVTITSEENFYSRLVDDVKRKMEERDPQTPTFEYLDIVSVIYPDAKKYYLAPPEIKGNELRIPAVSRRAIYYLILRGLSREKLESLIVRIGKFIYDNKNSAFTPTLEIIYAIAMDMTGNRGFARATLMKYRENIRKCRRLFDYVKIYLAFMEEGTRSIEQLLPDIIDGDARSLATIEIRKRKYLR